MLHIYTFFASILATDTITNTTKQAAKQKSCKARSSKQKLIRILIELILLQERFVRFQVSHFCITDFLWESCNRFITNLSKTRIYLAFAVCFYKCMNTICLHYHLPHLTTILPNVFWHILVSLTKMTVNQPDT